LTDFTIQQGSETGLMWPVSLVPAGALSDGSVRAQARKTVKSSTVLYAWSSEDGTASIDDEGGTITLWIPGEVSSGWAWRAAVYDVEYVDADGKPHRVDQGKLKIDPEVTR
jgi:hypothetical protein